MKIQIICSSPGMRRNGIAHPASAFYDADEWTKEELAAFQSDPAFVVREAVEATESTTTEIDFQLKVNAEVERLVALKADELQKGFDQAVQEAVADKVSALKSEHDNALDEAGKQLKAANDKAADLEKQLGEAAKKPAAAKK